MHYSPTDNLALSSLAMTKSQSFWLMVFHRLIRNRVALACAILLFLIALAAILAPLLAPADPYKTSMLRRLQPIGSPGALLGTDELGRDMLSRLIYGGRLSLLTGVAPVVIAFMIGGTLGISAGFIGGKINLAIMRTIDVFYAFPSILLAVSIAAVLGGGIVNSVIALTIVFIPPITRVAESVTTQINGFAFVEAARASGARTGAIIRTHILGNVLGPVLIYASSLISVSIIQASGLSFLGLGVRPPEAEWGLMLSTLRPAIYVDPWIAALPGVMIFITSIAFNLLSDGLRSAMDIKL